MSSAVSLYFREQILRRVFLAEPISSIAYLALCKTVPEVNTTGSLLLEPPQAFGYMRQSLVLNSTRWELTGYAEVQNKVEVNFGTPTGDWGMVNGWALCTASSVGTGEILASGSLVVPRRLGFGVEVLVKQGQIQFSLGDASA